MQLCRQRDCTWRIAKLTAKQPEIVHSDSELEVLSSDPLKIKFEHGSIIGAIDNETGAVTYLGIPYAAPPVDGLRFRPPQQHSLWRTENPFRFDARVVGSITVLICCPLIACQ